MRARTHAGRCVSLRANDACVTCERPRRAYQEESREGPAARDARKRERQRKREREREKRGVTGKARETNESAPVTFSRNVTEDRNTRGAVLRRSGGSYARARPRRTRLLCVGGDRERERLVLFISYKDSPRCATLLAFVAVVKAASRRDAPRNVVEINSRHPLRAGCRKLPRRFRLLSSSGWTITSR
ncbi:hypothetical protein PUN28_005527 [Cardiocondyla obscurior]|uniref:Uncharacterized protein n=1 Tax=Cardiocondyla obscurior TaxID=286306 RepID=A0AAW2GJA8_9HYME